MHVSVIVVAAGRGERAGSREPKQFIDLGGGRTMVSMSVDAFLASPQVAEVIVAVPPGHSTYRPPQECVRVVEGGSRRQDSMAKAFALVSAAADLIVIHDAARPFVSARLIAQTIDAARAHGAAIAAVPVSDTVKRVHGRRPPTVVRDTLPREEIYLAQTPQAFRRDVLEVAMAAGSEHEATDEAMLVERAGIPVHIVTGEAANGKVTTADDLARARQRVSDSESVRGGAIRVGIGYDLHRLVPDQPLILAGVRVPFERGLHGHSDADIVCHAVIDALLGAAGLGDVGQMFPDTEARWKDADSVALLREAVAAVVGQGYAVGNTDVTVIAERPKLLPYLAAMRANLASALGVETDRVSIKGKTNETVDAAGRGEAMACHAVALITRR